MKALGLSDPFTGAQLFAIDPQFRNPRAFQWGLGLERELTPGFTVGADYSDVHTVNLERNIDLNLPLPFMRESDPARRPVFGLRSVGQRPIASLGAVTAREASARSQYRALTLRARAQKRWGEVFAFYVLGKSLSDDDNEADVGGMTAENPYHLAPDTPSPVWTGVISSRAGGSFCSHTGWKRPEISRFGRACRLTRRLAVIQTRAWPELIGRFTLRGFHFDGTCSVTDRRPA